MPTKVLTIKLLSLPPQRLQGAPLTSLDNHSCLLHPCMLHYPQISQQWKGAGLFYYNSWCNSTLTSSAFFNIFFFPPPLFIWSTLIPRKQGKLVHALCRISEAICHIFTGTICYDKSSMVHTSWHKVQRGCHGENSTKRVIFACVTKGWWTLQRKSRRKLRPANLALAESSDLN